MTKKKIRPAKLTVAQWEMILVAVNRQIAACTIVAKSAGDGPVAYESAREREAYIEIVAEIDEQLE